VITLETLKGITHERALPVRLPALLKALWWDRQGRWDEAHRIAQDLDSAEAAWVHAYLHRKEGDLGNAAYWYRRAGHPPASDDLWTEWDRIAAALLENVASA
jgi:hypothetical protein